MPTYEFPRPALTADTAVFRGFPGEREVLLVRRSAQPFAGSWALPGGFVDEDEPLESAARRELLEETGIDPVEELMQVGAYGDPGRDPRGWTVTVLFTVVLGFEDAATAVAGDDASEAAWFKAEHLPPVAFDHATLIADALRVAAFGA